MVNGDQVQRPLYGPAQAPARGGRGTHRTRKGWHRRFRRKANPLAGAKRAGKGRAPIENILALPILPSLRYPTKNKSPAKSLPQHTRTFGGGATPLEYPQRLKRRARRRLRQNAVAHAHRFIRNAEISPLRRLSAGISAFRRNLRPADAPTKKTNPARGSFSAGEGVYCQYPQESLADPMEADLPPLKPGGTRRGAESGLWASCRISIPAGPTTASSG